MNNIDSRIADAALALNEVSIANEWSLDEWRGQLVNANELARELDQEAETEGRCV